MDGKTGLGEPYDDWPDEPRPVNCNRSCFYGMKGMDTCGGCGGTGSQLLANKKRFPNTQEGWKMACKELGVEGTAI